MKKVYNPLSSTQQEDIDEMLVKFFRAIELINRNSQPPRSESEEQARLAKEERERIDSEIDELADDIRTFLTGKLYI